MLLLNRLETGLQPLNKLSTSTPTITSGTNPPTLNTENRPPIFSANSKTLISRSWHSFLQLIIDGVRDKTVTFIKIADLKDNTIIPKSGDKNLQKTVLVNRPYQGNWRKRLSSFVDINLT
jgi:hypothetical protein